VLQFCKMLEGDAATPDYYNVIAGTSASLAGAVHIVRHLVAQDVGRAINPAAIEGQIRGAVAQGVGWGLLERMSYDEGGRLLSGTLMDYAVPRADDVPHAEIGHAHTPSPHNPLGVKGLGEAGTIGIPPAMVNAVVDALAPLGVTHLDMPLTPEKIWRALAAKR